MNAKAPWLDYRERGSRSATQFMKWLALRCGRRVARLLLVPICGYFLAFSPRARSTSRQYLALALGRPPRLADLWRHYFTFATTVLDRVYFIAGQFERFDIEVRGVDLLRRTLARGRGCLLLGAHLGSFELLRTLALFCSQDKNWPEARKYAERALAQAHGDAVAQFYLGRSLYYLKDYRASLAALEAIKSLATQNGDFDTLAFYLGALHWERGNYREAIDYHRIYLRHDPAHVDARAQLADALYHLGQSAEAVMQWQRIAHINASKAARLCKQAESAWQHGKPEQASEDLEQALKLDAGNTELVLLVARWRLTHGNLQGAADLLERHLAWNPDRPLAVALLSEVLARQNKLDRSRMLAARYRALTGEALETAHEN